MSHSFIEPETRSFDPGFAVASDHKRPIPACARGEHARLLAIAAARRLRALDRLREQRLEDAEYWIACAPVAVSKAADLRDAFTSLP